MESQDSHPSFEISISQVLFNIAQNKSTDRNFGGMMKEQMMFCAEFIVWKTV